MSRLKKLGVAISSEVSADARAPVIERTAELQREVIGLLAEVFDVRTARFRLLPAAFWQAIDPQVLVLFATMTARWGVVTVELVEWLRDRIGGRKAIEIGAGNGDLGFYLGIPQTDSFAHAEDPAAVHRSKKLGHPPPVPPPDVRKLDGLKAVHALRPEVVVASWVTQLGAGRDGDQSYHLGVRETAILEAADYIMIGNTFVHGEKRILSVPHEEIAAPWLVSRAQHPEGNPIWAWKRQRRSR